MEQNRYNKLKTAFDEQTPQMPDNFTDSVMGRIDRKSRRRPTGWMVAAAAAIAAMVVTGAALLQINGEQEAGAGVVAQATAVQPADAKPRPTTVDAKPRPMTTNEKPKPMTTDAKQRPMTADTKQRPMTADAKPRPMTAETKMTPIDSLTDIIARIESGLQQVRDSCYLANVEKLIRADDQLQKLVNNLILDGILTDSTTRVATIDNP